MIYSAYQGSQLRINIGWHQLNLTWSLSLGPQSASTAHMPNWRIPLINESAFRSQCQSHKLDANKISVLSIIAVGSLMPFGAMTSAGTVRTSSILCMRRELEKPLNTLGPRQNGRHFYDDIFKRIFLNENVRIDHKSALVQIMACRAGDKPLFEPMMA